MEDERQNFNAKRERDELGIVATDTNKGRPKNKKIVREFLSENLPQISLLPCDATYLMWIDCSNLINLNGGIPILTPENLKIPHFKEFKNSTELANFIRSKSGLYLSSGEIYGLGGENFLRLNIAVPKANLLDGLNRLKNALK